MNVSQILSPTEQIKNSTSATARARVTRDDFLRMLISELRSQDPLEPMKDTDFLNQMASLNQIESFASLTDGIRSLQNSNDLANASALIGKAVIGTTDSGLEGGGIVSRVVVDGGQVKLVIGNQSMPLSGVAQVFLPTAAEPPAAG